MQSSTLGSEDVLCLNPIRYFMHTIYESWNDWNATPVTVTDVTVQSEIKRNPRQEKDVLLQDGPGPTNHKRGYNSYKSRYNSTYPFVRSYARPLIGMKKKTYLVGGPHLVRTLLLGGAPQL